jgi:hypothetical protein
MDRTPSDIFVVILNTLAASDACQFALVNRDFFGLFPRSNHAKFGAARLTYAQTRTRMRLLSEPMRKGAPRLGCFECRKSLEQKEPGCARCHSTPAEIAEAAAFQYNIWARVSAVSQALLAGLCVALAPPAGGEPVITVVFASYRFAEELERMAAGYFGQDLTKPSDTDAILFLSMSNHPKHLDYLTSTLEAKEWNRVRPCLAVVILIKHPSEPKFQITNPVELPVQFRMHPTVSRAGSALGLDSGPPNVSATMEVAGYRTELAFDRVDRSAPGRSARRPNPQGRAHTQNTEHVLVFFGLTLNWRGVYYIYYI